MRMLLSIFFVVFTFFGPAPAAQVCKYSVRDLGFVDLVPPPFRLVLVHNGATILQAQHQELAIGKGLVHGNIRLVKVSAEELKTNGEFRGIQLPGKLAQPQFWLTGPDDRAVPFKPTTFMRDLVQSPMRHAIQHEVTHSLAVVLLLESTNDAANQAARAKAEKVLAIVNKVKMNFDKAPAGEIKLLALPVVNRPQERWTLWGLGEEPAASDTPKIAVLFGKMRRAGALFVGADWPEAELFDRMATLSQSAELELDRQQFFGSALPFVGSSDWQEKLADNLQFDPHSGAVKAEISALLKKAPQQMGQGMPRRMSFEAMMAAQREPLPDEGDPLQQGIENVPPVGGEIQRPAFPATAPSNFANGCVAFVFLIAGIAGWILLGLSVWMLERRQITAKPS